jgi:hypothetical protein
MAISETPSPQPVEPPRLSRGQRTPMATAVAIRIQLRVVDPFTGAIWKVLHAMGAHRWREGYETDLERGWRRYRGSRCTICDEPWEGW